MSQTRPTLYYVHDPMCSWCWGYKPTWQTIQRAIAGDIDIVYVAGGLAEDSDIAMPIEMRRQIELFWRKIERLLGTQFNYDFWTENTPRRSTYPSCRAVLAARIQGYEIEMIEHIQYAYYLGAQNPSDDHVLIELSEKIGMDVMQFSRDYQSESVNQQLHDEITFARSIGGNSFPSLFFQQGDHLVQLPIDYENSETTIRQLQSQIK